MSKGISKEQLSFLRDIIDKLIGPAQAIGETIYDGKAQENLKVLGDITHHLFEELWDIKKYNLDRYEHSMKINGQLANQYVESIGDYYYDYFYEYWEVEKQRELIKLYKKALQQNYEGIDLIRLVESKLREQIKELENEKI